MVLTFTILALETKLMEFVFISTTLLLSPSHPERTIPWVSKKPTKPNQTNIENKQNKAKQNKNKNKTKIKKQNESKQNKKHFNKKRKQQS